MIHELINKIVADHFSVDKPINYLDVRDVFFCLLYEFIF